MLERTQKAPSLFKKGLSGLGKTYDGNLVKQKVSLSDTVPFYQQEKIAANLDSINLTGVSLIGFLHHFVIKAQTLPKNITYLYK